MKQWNKALRVKRSSVLKRDWEVVHLEDKGHEAAMPAV